MKQRSNFKLNAAIGIFLLLMVASCSQKQNWPQFRGPEGNMIVTGKHLAEEWDSVKNVRWIYKLEGSGWSSPVVWGNKVFISSTFPEKVAPVPEMGPRPPRPDEGAGQEPRQNPSPQGGQGMRPGPDQNLQPRQGLQQGQAPQPGQRPRGPGPENNDTSFKADIYRWEITCIDLSTGKEMWKQVAFKGNPKGNKNPQNTYASETPVTDGKRIYVYFGMTGLYCYDMEGKLLWQKDLGAFKTQNGWGTGSSPIIYKDVLYLQVDNDVNSFITSIDAATGDEKWRVQRDEKTNYSTPYIWKNKIRTELVTCGKTSRSYDPETGRILWELKTGGEQTIPSPVGDEGHLYLGNAGGQEVKGNLFAVKAGAEGDISPKEGEMTSSGVEWIVPDAGLGNASPLLYSGLIYLISSRGDINCINAVNGAQVYKTKLKGAGAIWASPWVYNDKIFFFDEKGVTHVMKAGDKFEILSENKLNDKFWASVAITGNTYLFKGVEKLYCIK